MCIYATSIHFIKTLDPPRYFRKTCISLPLDISTLSQEFVWMLKKSFNSGGTRKSNNEWKGVVEVVLQTWSIDLVLVIIKRGILILGVPPPWGARPHPLKPHLLVKWKWIKPWMIFFLLYIFWPRAWVHKMVKMTLSIAHWKGSKIDLKN